MLYMASSVQANCVARDNLKTNGDSQGHLIEYHYHIMGEGEAGMGGGGGK